MKEALAQPKLSATDGDQGGNGELVPEIRGQDLAPHPDRESSSPGQSSDCLVSPHV